MYGSRDQRRRVQLNIESDLCVFVVLGWDFVWELSLEGRKHLGKHSFDLKNSLYRSSLNWLFVCFMIICLAITADLPVRNDIYVLHHRSNHVWFLYSSQHVSDTCCWTIVCPKFFLSRSSLSLQCVFCDCAWRSQLTCLSATIFILHSHTTPATFFISANGIIVVLFWINFRLHCPLQPGCESSYAHIHQLHAEHKVTQETIAQNSL